MAGIYIHIPYCRQKCNYCNFFSIVSRKSAPEMIVAICREMEIRANEITDNNIETIYLGGGTPSLLEQSLLSNLLSTAFNSFHVSANAEITLEANPDDINTENLSFWKSLGINRLSIGIQSFRDEDLSYLNRVHTASKALECIELARSFGFPDLTIDLIYGILTLTNDAWQENLEIFARLQIPHLSAYALTVEPRTPLFLQIERGDIKPVDEKQSSEQFEILMDFAASHGYLHYEISNFCKPGHFAKHNLSYWQGIPYYGFGPSAHSFDGKVRQWNVSSVSEYLKSMKDNIVPFEREYLSAFDRYNEFVMTGLRTMWGCNLEEMKKSFGDEFSNYFTEHAEKWISRQLMIKEGSTYKLTPKGRFQADGIASDLFMVN